MRLEGRAARRRPDVGGAAYGRVTCYAVAVAPLVLLPGGLFRFALPKLVLLAVVLGLAALAPASGRLPRAVVVIAGTGALWAVVAALLGEAPFAQLVGRWPRYEGLVALPLYAGALWAGARVVGPAAPAAVRRALLRGLTGAAVAVAAIAAAEATGARPLGGDVSRPGSLLGNASDQGVVGVLILALLLPPLVSSPFHQRTAGSAQEGAPGMPVLALGAAAAATTVVLSGSRGALLGVLVAVVVQTGLVAGRAAGLGRARVVVVGVGVVMVIALAALAVPATAARLGVGIVPAVNAPHASIAPDTVQGRAVLWSETVGLVAERPWTGAGPSGFVDAAPDRHTERWALVTDATNPPDSPHSWPLQVAAAGGLPLLALTVALAAVVLRTGLQRWQAETRAGGGRAPRPLLTGRAGLLLGLAGATVGYGVALGAYFTTPGTSGLAAFLVGALVAEPSTSQRPAQRAIRWVVGVVALVWGVTLAAGGVAELHLQRAAVLAARGEVIVAEDAVRDAARWRPWDPDLPLLAAQVFVAGAHVGDRASADAALRWSDQALVRTPRSLEAARVRAVALLALGRPDEATGLLDALLLRSPYDDRLLLARGSARAAAGRWAAAQKDLERAATYAPHDPLVWQNLAVVYGARGADAESEAAASRARELAPAAP